MWSLYATQARLCQFFFCLSQLHLAAMLRMSAAHRQKEILSGGGAAAAAEFGATARLHAHAENDYTAILLHIAY